MKFKKIKTKSLLLSVLLPMSLLAAFSTSQASREIESQASIKVTYRTYHYTCDGNKKMSVSYVKYGTKLTFAVVNWNAGQYGLAAATSASGARYASLAGSGAAFQGLEWWEHQGEGTLSAFTSADTSKTKILLSYCRTK